MPICCVPSWFSTQIVSAVFQTMYATMGSQQLRCQDSQAVGGDTVHREPAPAHDGTEELKHGDGKHIAARENPQDDNRGGSSSGYDDAKERELGRRAAEVCQ